MMQKMSHAMSSRAHSTAMIVVLGPDMRAMEALREELILEPHAMDSAKGPCPRLREELTKLTMSH
jgi:hypothetical protein